jgi:hypothetical protein
MGGINSTYLGSGGLRRMWGGRSLGCDLRRDAKRRPVKKITVTAQRSGSHGCLLATSGHDERL